jgi:hypothetical protein
VANKFSSPPTGTEKRLPVGYKNKTVSVFGNCPVRKYIQSSGCFFPAAGSRSTSGELYGVGLYGDRWTSSPGGSSSAYASAFGSSAVAAPGTYSRAQGFTVRYVKEFILVFYYL